MYKCNKKTPKKTLMTYDLRLTTQLHKCSISFHTYVVSQTANCQLYTAHCTLPTGKRILCLSGGIKKKKYFFKKAITKNYARLITNKYIILREKIYNAFALNTGLYLTQLLHLHKKSSIAIEKVCW